MYIINSLLDIDFYKLTMGQLIFHMYPDVFVRFGFTNRTKGVVLPDYIPESVLRRELDHVRTLQFQKRELKYLRSLDNEGSQLFQEDYLEFLRNLQLPEYELKRVDDSYLLEFPGLWKEAIYWETIALSIINELYYRSVANYDTSNPPSEALGTGIGRLSTKSDLLQENPQMTFTDFGTRRRFSRNWQETVVSYLNNVFSPTQFLGTSNTYLAMKYRITPMGTSAHEMYMVMSAIMQSNDDELYSSHNQVLQDWWDEYGEGLSVALTDTYGTDFFFRDMTSQQAHDWRGLRHDSGDPIEFGEKAIKFYEEYGIDPKEKLLVFSDGLDLDTITKIHNHFYSRIRITFGWGTNLTNDLGYEPLSLVVKVIEADGIGTVKLSDNLAKAMGSEEDIERFKRVFDYTNELFEDVRY